MSTEENIGSEPTIIKKYANRRLYNTGSSTYVTLDDLAVMVKQGEDFIVRDAKTDEDITRSVLTQIIFEEEAKGQNLLPINFLRQLIGFYGDSMQNILPSYLEHSIASFSTQQEKLREQMSSAFGGMDVFKAGEEMAKHNLAMFQQTMQMFNPMSNMTGQTADKKTAKPKSSDEEKSDLSSLKDQLNAMQQQLDAMAKSNKQ